MKVKFYGIVSNGIEESENGRLIKVDELIEYLNYCLDDDELIRDRVQYLQYNLIENKTFRK